jgi:hypothetical protein
MTPKKERRAKARRIADWERLPKEQLLDVPIRKLDLRIEGTEIEPLVAELHAELAARGFKFQPHVWLSDEWYCPDGVPGFAVPFFLAHARLKRLEQEFMLEVEGGEREACLALMRHETAHAIANAYRVHRRRDWQKHFGRSSQRYPTSYVPHPYSKRFVTHLDNWYAQSHPDEDWAETFAVWLTPGVDWRERYRGWPALKKLEYVNTLMNELRDARPSVRNRRRQSPAHEMRITLRSYYRAKQARYGAKHPAFYDDDLRRLFPGTDTEHEAGARWLRRHRNELTSIVAGWTGEFRYRIDQVLGDMIKRSDELKLRVHGEDPKLKLQVIAFLTRLVMDYLHTGKFRVRVRALTCRNTTPSSFPRKRESSAVYDRRTTDLFKTWISAYARMTATMQA